MSQTAKDIGVLLFDLDGTLLDSRDFLVTESYNIIEKYYPGKYMLEKVKEDFGNGFARLLPDLVAEHNKRALHEFHTAKVERYHKIVFFPGVIESLHKLKTEGYKLGIVTNQNKQVATGSLQENNLLELFDVIIGVDDVREGKPSPEGIMKAMDDLGCQKQEVIMIGDSRYDIMAGKNAGILTGFLKWYTDLQMPNEHAPDFVYENFEMLLSTLIEKSD